MSYSCCDKHRRGLLERQHGLNGIDFVVVSGKHELKVHFVKKLHHELSPENIRIEGGARVRNIKVIGVSKDADGAPNVLIVRLSEPGDFASYTLRLIDPAHPKNAPSGYDPAFAAAEFSFKFKTQSEFDPRRQLVPPETPFAEPIIDYLAKDYSSFRRLLLNRLATVSPDWRELRLPDVGIALVELLAYVGDYLSYQQDAVATEAYLGTARRRVSVRRHARLIDYPMHDGCNARAWVQVQVMGERGKAVRLNKDRTQFLTGSNGEAVQDDILNPVMKFDSAEHKKAWEQGAVVFEPVYDTFLFPEHNQMRFHTWSDERCCLRRGATHATLAGYFPNLRPGDVLIFEEICDPLSGESNDSDVRMCHAVMLSTVEQSIDPLNAGAEITEISWAEADALPFPLCLSARTAAQHDERDIGSISVARGNIVLVDHGRTISPAEQLREGQQESVPEQTMFRARKPGEDRCGVHQQKPIMPRFRPELGQKKLTQAVPYKKERDHTSATDLLKSDPRSAEPRIRLESLWQSRPGAWIPKRDLLNSGPNKMEFVAETESDGRTFLRFGDNQHGLRPAQGTSFTAVYRVGNGKDGNVGTEAIAYLATDDSLVQKAIADVSCREGGNAIRNPMPAVGGTDAESINHVRRAAPAVVARNTKRAVTEQDYARLIESEYNKHVQKVEATFRWSGSWHTVFLAIDRKGGGPLDHDLKRRILDFLEPYRATGYDLEIVEPWYVPLEIGITIHVKQGYFRGNVKQDTLEELSNRNLPEGRHGFFHPDELTFGQPVYLSKLCARAQTVAGVASVEIAKFQRRDTPDKSGLEREKLEFDRLEIARLDNNPNFPEFGTLTLELEGGK